MSGVGSGGAAGSGFQPAQVRGASRWWWRVPVPGTVGCTGWTWIEVSVSSKGPGFKNVTRADGQVPERSRVSKEQGANSPPAAPQAKQP